MGGWVGGWVGGWLGAWVAGLEGCGGITLPLVCTAVLQAVPSNIPSCLPTCLQVPVFDWRVLAGAVRRIDLGGKALTNFMKELVSYRWAGSDCTAGLYCLLHLLVSELSPWALSCPPIPTHTLPHTLSQMGRGHPRPRLTLAAAVPKVGQHDASPHTGTLNPEHPQHTEP